MIVKLFGVLSIALLVGGCSFGGCTKYASDFSCSYVIDEAEYEVWYWKRLSEDNEEDNLFIGHAVGLHMCESNARAFAAAIDEEFSYRAYICVLMRDGRRKEKHRLLA